MTKDRDRKTKVRLEKHKSRSLKQDRIKFRQGDEILESMLNTPPQTHEEMKEK